MHGISWISTRENAYGARRNARKPHTASESGWILTDGPALNSLNAKCNWVVNCAGGEIPAQRQNTKDSFAFLPAHECCRVGYPTALFSVALNLPFLVGAHKQAEVRYPGALMNCRTRNWPPARQQISLASPYVAQTIWPSTQVIEAAREWSSAYLLGSMRVL